MISDEDRREVARKMRLNAWTAPYMNTSDDFAREVFRAAMNEAVGDYRAAIDRLADLIEPEPERTCRPEKRWKEYSAWPYYVCSECGEPLNYRETEDDYELLPYCAGCGAKVIE